MFENISIMGRVIYIIYAIEVYLTEKDDLTRWNILLEALWSFTQYERNIDDYAYKLIECTPENVLDEREDFSTFEYFREEELYELRNLYSASESTAVVDYFMGKIYEILACNLYTTVKPPEEMSLEIIGETYSYMKKLLGKRLPEVKPFEIYSIYDEDSCGKVSCWGRYEQIGREALLEHMENISKGDLEGK